MKKHIVLFLCIVVCSAYVSQMHATGVLTLQKHVKNIAFGLGKQVAAHKKALGVATIVVIPVFAPTLYFIIVDLPLLYSESVFSLPTIPDYLPWSILYLLSPKSMQDTIRKMILWYIYENALDDIQ